MLKFVVKNNFDVNEFDNEVISNPRTKQVFKEYIEEFQNENDVFLLEKFDI